MPFKDKVKRAMGRSPSSATSPSSSATQSNEISRVATPSLHETISAPPLNRENLTIDPRENPLTQIDSNATLKKRSTLSKIRSSFKKEDPYKDWPEDIYKPHEMPRQKYRRPVDPDHAFKLNSYSLRSAFADMRRRSGVSLYSPMGSRLPSRRGSISSRFGRSTGPSRNHSIAEVVDENQNPDDDVANVGLSRHHTNEIYPSQALPLRSRGGTMTTTSTIPDLVPSSSIDSDDTDSILNASQPLTDGDLSRPEGYEELEGSFGKPFDEVELARAFTAKLIASNC